MTMPLFDFGPEDCRNMLGPDTAVLRGFALGDVSGKGMPAALLMAACRSNLRHFAEAEENPCVVLGRLNDLLRTDFPQGNFVTMIYSVLDLATGDLSVASAGHPAPLIVVDGSAQVVAIDNGLPLGIADSLYPETRLHLEMTTLAARPRLDTLIIPGGSAH